MLSRTSLFILLLFFTVTACDNQPAKSKVENPLADQLKALEKAKNVEQELMDEKQRTDDAIKKATQ